MYLKYRSPISIILISIFTLRLYDIYYIVDLQNQIRSTYIKKRLLGGVTTFILSVLTLGLYFIYWMYKTGSIIEELLEDNKIAYLKTDKFIFTGIGVLSFSTIYFAFIQSKINLVIEKRREINNK